MVLGASACGLLLDADPRNEGAEVDGGAEGGIPDASRDSMRVDASMDSGFVDGCVALVEICNGLDDDCDGRTDEDFDFATDPSNCGTCGTSCSLAGVIPTCIGGACQIVCQDGWMDCDGNADNGCEADLSTPLTCGDCGVSCGSGPCGDIGGVFECLSACPAAEENCGGICTDTYTDRNNCGFCGNLCPDSDSCVGGACTPSSCDDPTSWGFAPDATWSCRGTCGSATIYCDLDGIFCHCEPVGGTPARLCTGVSSCGDAVTTDCCRP